MNDSCIHSALGRWEVNPVSLIYTRRCVRCGRVLEHMTNAEAVKARTHNPTSAPPKEQGR